MTWCLPECRPIIEAPNLLISIGGVRTTQRVGAPFMESIEILKKKLATERTLLDRMHEQVHANFIAVSNAGQRKLEVATACAR